VTMAVPPDNDWFFVRNGERHGPVSLAKLQQLAKTGWLTPEDVVWHESLPSWTPAGQVPGLHGGALSQMLRSTIPGVKTPPPAVVRPATEQRRSRNRPQAARFTEGIDLDNLTPWHLVAGCGGFLTVLGIAFTAIAQSRVSLAFTLSGLVTAAIGLHVEIGRLLGQAIENIGKASKEAADRRLRAKELALEKQRLDVEATRIAQEQAAREATVPPVTPAAVLVNQQADHISQAPAGSGHVVVINHPPVQRWSPGLAAVLSFFVPGLGQLYKGQILNGIVWFFAVGMGYVALILPGLVLHFFCVLGALSGNPWTEGKTTVMRE
jgi:TM2 domain-containing membrane protein YozV